MVSAVHRDHHRSRHSLLRRMRGVNGQATRAAVAGRGEAEDRVRWYRQTFHETRRQSPAASHTDPYVEFTRTGLIRIVDPATGQHVTLPCSRHVQQVVTQLQIVSTVTWPDSDRFEESEHE